MSTDEMKLKFPEDMTKEDWEKLEHIEDNVYCMCKDCRNKWQDVAEGKHKEHWVVKKLKP